MEITTNPTTVRQRAFQSTHEAYLLRAVAPFLTLSYCSIQNIREALWSAQLHPLRSSDSLDDDEVARLHSGIRLALLQALEHGGSTLRDYRNGYGEPGSNQEHFNVYDRRGQPCPRCGTPIERIVVGQRGTHLCPFCQRIESDERLAIGD